MRKLSVFLLSLLLFCSSMIGSTVVSSAAEVVPDENLRKVINLELGNGEVTDSITIAQLNSLTGTLYASDKDIESIEGLQYATGLTRIYLIGNQISDTGPVSGLTSLKGLYLSENQIADVTSLSGLTNLTQLSLNENEIKTLLSDSKVTGRSYKWKSNFMIYFKADGTYSGKVANGKKDVSGTWDIVKGNVKCMYGSNGRTVCSKHFKEGDKYYSVKGNMITSDFTVTKQ